MPQVLSLIESLKNYEKLVHEFQFRDRIKSAEYHYATPFEFDGFFEDSIVEMLFDKMKLISKEVEFVSFKLGVTWPSGSSDVEKSHLKHSIQTPLIVRLTSIGKTIGSTIPDAEFLIDFEKKLLFLRLRSVYIMGKYTKHVRDIAQTEYFCNKCRGKGCWYCLNTGHFSKESVEQLLAEKMVPALKAKLLILHGAGREDLDVLMLKKGRPFIAELLMPLKRSADLGALEKEINSSFKGKISVSSLAFCSTHDVAPLKDSLHEKIYAACIVSDKNVNPKELELNKIIEVSQNTPSRVESRRAHLQRKKTVELLSVGLISQKEFVLKLKTSHGTYVKEFISGDSGKTSPSISSMLGANCTCKLLDVMEICD